jgi:choline dehydrogenase-like flavoprotein
MLFCRPRTARSIKLQQPTPSVRSRRIDARRDGGAATVRIGSARPRGTLGAADGATTITTQGRVRMLVDGRHVPAGTTIETDVCVVGTGPAGTTLARELIGQPFRVCVLESGGPELEAETQALTEGVQTGDPTDALPKSRRRQLGGTPHAWDSRAATREVGLRCAPLDAVDFRPKAWLPEYPAWPLSRTDLDPYYARAHAAYRLGPYKYDAADWECEQARQLPVDGAVLRTNVWQYGAQAPFVSEFPAQVAAAGNVTVYHHANVVEVETNDTASEATGVRVACLSGGTFAVRAKVVVLATGGIENARLLLLSDRAQPGGLGNGHDLVGRYFMEHQFVHGGTFVPASRAVFDRMALYDTRRANGASATGKLYFTEEVLERERLMNVSFAFLPKHRRYLKARDEYVQSFNTLLRSAARLRLPAEAGQHARNAWEGIDYVGARMLRKLSGGRWFRHFDEGPDLVYGGGWSAEADRHRKYSVFAVILHTEQAPHRENRVTLDDGRDALGARRVRLHWEWRAADIDSVSRAEQLFAGEIARAGLGRFEIARDAAGRPVLVGPGLHHHMGTTRMHDDPRQGVVDREGRVHGVPNLLVAGCSVFPTGGYINPTLTIVALSIRMADYVKEAMRPGAPVLAGAAPDRAATVP